MSSPFKGAFEGCSASAVNLQPRKAALSKMGRNKGVGRARQVA